MGSRIECFWLEPTEMGRSELRRYEKIEYNPMPPPSCPQNPMKHHDTTVYLEDIPYPFDPQGLLGYGRDDVDHSDPHWPTVCDVCGTPFKDTDNWQHNVSRLFKGAPDGKLYTTRTMPPGSMYDAEWWPDKGPDGIALCVVLPPNGGADYWHPDEKRQGGWTRTGTIPKITCHPSILTPRYHGWLRDGWLISV
jgi:hypothetical protein